MDVNQPVPIAVALTAGLLSFLSPCVLPLIPGYIAFISGRSLEELTAEDNRRALLWSTGLRAALFVAGFTAVFTALGASASAVGRWLAAATPWLSKVAGAVIALLGLHMMGVVHIPWLNYERRLSAGRVPPGAFGAVLVGMAFAFGWTPCIGPILAGILALAAAQDTVLRGTVLLFAYSLGLGIPFVATAMGLSAFLKLFARYKRFTRWGELAAGGLLVVLGLLLATNRLATLIRFVPTTFSRFAR